LLHNRWPPLLGVFKNTPPLLPTELQQRFKDHKMLAQNLTLVAVTFTYSWNQQCNTTNHVYNLFMGTCTHLSLSMGMSHMFLAPQPMPKKVRCCSGKTLAIHAEALLSSTLSVHFLHLTAVSFSFLQSALVNLLLSLSITLDISLKKRVYMV
jgi:hypothetical protein